MTAGAYCTREVIVTDSQTTVSNAAKLMRQYHVGDLVVMEKRGAKNIPIGIITDRDLVVEVLAQDVPLDAITVADVMSTSLVAVQEHETLVDTLSLMQRRGVRRALVLSRDGGLQGILSADDAVEILAEVTHKLALLCKREIVQEQRQRP